MGGTSYDDVDPHSDIYIAETDGSGVRALTDYPGLDGFPVWSPNGRWIMFASDRDASASQRSANADGDLDGVGIYVMTAEGDGVRPILSVTDREVSFPSAWRP